MAQRSDEPDKSPPPVAPFYAPVTSAKADRHEVEPASPPPVLGAPGAAVRSESSASGRTAWVVGGIIAAVAVVVVFLAIGTARHWTKVDVPEHAETFHSEEYLTGQYNITNDRVSPCWINQDWTDCINLMVNEYNRACVGVALTSSASSTCNAYSTEIDRMKQQGGWGYVVTSLGGYGHLNRSQETGTRQVSNNDYRPAVTHEAVCYLGFIGECR